MATQSKAGLKTRLYRTRLYVGFCASVAGVLLYGTTARADEIRVLSSVGIKAVVDELARVTFRPPYDGYVQRMLWIAADEGAIPEEFATDPYRPGELADDERAEVLRVVRQCRDQVRQ